MKPTMYRQGDVLVVGVDLIPGDAEPVDRDRGRVVLAYGEATGHAHAISDAGAVMLELDGERFLRVVGGTAALAHQEHDTIVLPPGEYRVIRQREYAPEAPRFVAD